MVEANGLYSSVSAEVDHSQSLELKARDLLKKVQLKYFSSFTKFVDNIMESIKSVIRNIPEDLEVSSDISPEFIRDLGVGNVEFKFKQPMSFEIGGSYSTRCIARPDVNFDLFMRLPKACFGNKDYLDHRYFAKRCLYLCIIKKYLELSLTDFKFVWSTFQNEARKPILIVYPAVKLAENHDMFIRIIPTAKALFKISKLRLDRRNLTSCVGEDTPQASPRYNSSILEDVFLEDNSKFINKVFSEWDELRDALILMKVWARQRQSIYTYNCLSGFLLSALMAFIATKSGNKIINASMKPMEIFQVTLQFIATSVSWKSGLYFQLDGQKNISEEEKNQNKQLFPMVICDPFAHFNIAFRVTCSAFLELQEEAALTIDCMEKCCNSGFTEVFSVKVDLPAKYDYCMRLNLRNSISPSEFCLDDECWRSLENKIYLVLQKGLGDRAKLIRVIWRNTPSECEELSGFSLFDGEPLLVGISFSSLESALRMTDIGPSAENKEEALKFRKFWGEKAELRMFKDGRIAESVVWESKEWERHLIVKRITEYVMDRHLSIAKENVVHVVDQLDFSLVHGNKGSLLETFDVLSKRLRGITDIPLRICSVHPVDPAFRFSSVFAPTSHALATEKVPRSLPKMIYKCIQSLEVIIQLEGSGKWHMDEVAVERTKSAFLLKIAESLENKWGMIFTATENDIDIFLSGYAFRLKILHERGLSLLKSRAEFGKKKVASIDKKLFFSSMHSSMISGLQGRHPIYGHIVRLAKRWVFSHLFSSILEEEAVELLVAHAFSHPWPFSVPCSRVSGFLRFLRLLAEHDWNSSCLVIDINNDMKLQDKMEIADYFMLNRGVQNGNTQKSLTPWMFLGTSYDRASEAWTAASPNSTEVRRLAAYARSSADLITRLVFHDLGRPYSWECLFRTPLNNYDAVILVHSDKLAFPSRLLFQCEPEKELGRHIASGSAGKDFHPFFSSEDRKVSVEEMKKKLMVDFDPLRSFVSDLKREFPEEFKLWYDLHGAGDAVGLTWSSSSKKRCRDENEEGGREGDMIDVLRKVGNIGKGFVRSVYLTKA